MCGLTSLDGQDGEVVNRVDLSIQRLGRADDAAQSVDVKETLQIRVPVDGVPGQNIAKLLLDSRIDLTFHLCEKIITLLYHHVVQLSDRVNSKRSPPQNATAVQNI